jgi:hypothetical protein
VRSVAASNSADCFVWCGAGWCRYRSAKSKDILVGASGKMVLLDKLLPKLRAEGRQVQYSFCKVHCSFLLVSLLGVHKVPSLLSTVLGAFVGTYDASVNPHRCCACCLNLTMIAGNVRV